MGDNAKKIAIEVNHDNKELPIELTLTCNIDIPTRSVFKHLEQQLPSVKLIYWFLESTNILKYATIIECKNGDTGIWCGLFCNQHFIIPKKEK